jgi:hypothetical protein
VRGEEGNAVLLEELLLLHEHAIEPREELLGAVIGVDWCRLSVEAAGKGPASALTDNGDAVNRSDGADVVGGSDGTSNRRLLLVGAVLDALAGEVGGTTLACLQTNHQLSISARARPRVERMGGERMSSYIMGALASRAASRVATTVLLEVTLTAGMAKPFSRA